MVDENLARLGDRELLKLFAFSSTPTLTRRSEQIIAELERRSYIFDRKRKDLLTCDQWQMRYGSVHEGCDHEARLLSAREQTERRKVKG